MNCKVCQSNKIRFYRKVNNYNLLKCKNCRVIFLENIDELIDSQNFYNEDYFENYLYESELNFEQIKNTAKYYLTYIQKNFGVVQSVLDVGAGFGLFVKAFRELGLKAEGVEISKYSAKTALEKFKVELFNDELIKYPSNDNFDLICFYHSFAHLPDPVSYITKASELLSNRGILWLSLPNVMSLDRFLNKDKWNGWSLPYHLFHYSPSSIRKLLLITGFNKIKIQKSFLNPLRLIRRNDGARNLEISGSINYSRLKEIVRLPATLIFTGQNMNVFALKK